MIVVWFVGLVAVFATTLAIATRSYVSVAANVADAARARHLADGGANLAIRQLMALQRAPDEAANPFSGGPSYRCVVSQTGWLEISVGSELGKIDINTADTAYKQALFRGLGATPATTAAVLDRLADYIDRDDIPRTDGAESQTYSDAGLAWSPRNDFLSTVDELGAVWGLPSELLQRARPFLTVHSGLEQPELQRADTRLRNILRDGGLKEEVASGTGQDLIVRGDRDVVDIRVAAQTASGARFVRRVIVELEPRGRTRFRLRRWAQLFKEDFESVGNALAIGAAETYPPCL